MKRKIEQESKKSSEGGSVNTEKKNSPRKSNGMLKKKT